MALLRASFQSKVLWQATCHPASFAVGAVPELASARRPAHLPLAPKMAAEEAVLGHCWRHHSSVGKLRSIQGWMQGWMQG